jgi:hypothetical protein
MKKIFLLVVLLAGSQCFSQSVILYESFNTYNGTIGSIPAGFTITWNDSTGTNSFYTGATSCGQACNSYKFGWDSATIITPVFANPGSVQFFFKGNGTVNNQNTFYVYESPDGSTWNQVAAVSGFNTSQQTLSYPLQPNTIRLKFYYSKPVLGLNVAFDDLTVFGPSAINEPSASEWLNLFPTPSQGLITLQFKTPLSGFSYTISNLIGKKLIEGNVAVSQQKYILDLSELADGIYFIRIKTTEGEASRRFIIRR